MKRWFAAVALFVMAFIVIGCTPAEEKTGDNAPAPVDNAGPAGANPAQPPTGG